MAKETIKSIVQLKDELHIYVYTVWFAREFYSVPLHSTADYSGLVWIGHMVT